MSAHRNEFRIVRRGEVRVDGIRYRHPALADLEAACVAIKVADAGVFAVLDDVDVSLLACDARRGAREMGDAVVGRASPASTYVLDVVEVSALRAEVAGIRLGPGYLALCIDMEGEVVGAAAHPVVPFALSHAFRNAIQFHGVPDVVKIDNGHSARSVIKEAEALGVMVDRATPYQGAPR